MNLRLALGTTTMAASILASVIAAQPRNTAGDLGVAGRTNANPSIAAAGRFVALAWGATKDNATDVYVAVSRDSGRVFSAPVRANDTRSQAKLSGEQPPRLSLVPRPGLEPSIVVVWTTATPGGTRLISARSDDGGRTFASPKVVPASDAAGNRGWQTVATADDGSVVALWLDHRELADSSGGHMTHATHSHPANGPRDGAERAQMSKLFFGRLDGGTPARSITGGVCYCCKTALATGPNGAIYAAWRHVYAGNHRDIAFTMSRDRGRTFSPPVRVSEDEWQLDGCPENGPAIAVDASARVHVVWPTLINESGRETLALFHAVSLDGRSFSRRVRVPSTGPAYHPQLAMTGGGDLFLAWDEFVDGKRNIRAARGRPSATGSVPLAAVPLPSDSRGTYPAIAATADGAIAVWVTPESRLALVTW